MYAYFIEIYVIIAKLKSFKVNIKLINRQKFFTIFLFNCYIVILYFCTCVCVNKMFNVQFMFADFSGFINVTD